ncbi:unnamed protein product [Soboliphyme baturini]|uniref:Transmembrane protein n=1 Tax=Soboliphyme baturini TaxID=241478 RepID=A0A183INM2_9BILA|nr:unnamed protein product [Soboliphyme baturini]
MVRKLNDAIMEVELEENGSHAEQIRAAPPVEVNSLKFSVSAEQYSSAVHRVASINICAQNSSPVLLPIHLYPHLLPNSLASLSATVAMGTQLHRSALSALCIENMDNMVGPTADNDFRYVLVILLLACSIGYGLDC